MRTEQVFKTLSEPYLVDLDKRSYLLGTFHVDRLGYYSPQNLAYIGSIVRNKIYRLIKVQSV